MKTKMYTFQTIDQDGAIETYHVEAHSLKEAKEYRTKVVGNSRCGEENYGRITLK